MRIVTGFFVVAVALSGLLGCDSTGNHGKAARLASAYGDLNTYWAEVADSLGITPAEGQLKEWTLSYGAEGEIRSLRLIVYVERSPGKIDRYTVVQDQTGLPTWTRTQSDNTEMVATVPAGQFFSELQEVGYRQLEAQQGISPPVLSWFNAVDGTTRYGAEMHTHLIIGGRITPAPPEGVVMKGNHGTLQMTATALLSPGSVGTSGSASSTASYPGDSPPLYLIPRAGCTAESTNAANVSAEWACKGDH